MVLNCVFCEKFVNSWYRVYTMFHFNSWMFMPIWHESHIKMLPRGVRTFSSFSKYLSNSRRFRYTPNTIQGKPLSQLVLLNKINIPFPVSLNWPTTGISSHHLLVNSHVWNSQLGKGHLTVQGLRNCPPKAEKISY